MRHWWAMSQCAFSEVRILGNAASTQKPFAHRNSEHGTVAACVTCVRFCQPFWIGKDII